MRLPRSVAAALLVVGLALESLGLWVLIVRPSGWLPVLGILFAFGGLVALALGFGSLAGELLARRLGRIALVTRVPGDPPVPPSRALIARQAVPLVIWAALTVVLFVLAVATPGPIWFLFALFLLLTVFRVWVVVVLTRARRRGAPAPPVE